MKKTLVLLLLVMAIVGTFGFAQAEPNGECGAGATAGLPVDAACTDSNPAPAQSCTLWIDGVDPAVNGCHNP